ncbi:MAG: TolC family protein [bacterium]
MKVLKITIGCACLLSLIGCTQTNLVREIVQAQAPKSPSTAFTATIERGTETTQQGGVDTSRGRLATMPDPNISGRTLTLANSIRIALERNPKTRVSWRESLSAAARAGEVSSAYWPDVEISSGAVRADSVTAGSAKAQGPINTYNADFGVHYLLFDAGVRSNQVKGARAELLAANFRHNASMQDVAFHVEEAYYDLLTAGWLVKVSEDSLKQAERHWELAAARHAAGVAIRSDVLKAETEKAQAALALVQARSAERIARGQLADAMGIVVSQDFNIADVSYDLHKQEVADIDRLLQEAAKMRPELLASLARIEIQKAQVRTERSRYWPALTAEASYGLRDDIFLPEKDEWSIGVGLHCPLFTGFEREYRIERAKSDLARAQAEYEKALHGIELEVWTAYVNVLEVDEAIGAAETLVRSAEENALAAEAEYKNGTGTIIDLIDAQNSLTSARARLIQARLGWYKATARVEKSIGSLLAGHMLAVGLRSSGQGRTNYEQGGTK